MTTLYLAVPCYNEEEVLYDTTEKLLAKFGQLLSQGKISGDSRIMYIDDGSKDRTWEIICELHDKNRLVSGASSAGTAAIKTPCTAA